MNDRSVCKYRLRNPPRFPMEPRTPDWTEATGAVVIPVFDEPRLEETLNSIERARGARRIAVICVVNHPPEASEAGKAANAALLRSMRNGEITMPLLFLIDAGELSDGVGEARKIGFDAVLSELPPERADGFPCYSLDGDTTISADYFSVLESAYQAAPTVAALIPSLRHQDAETPELERAIRSYERYLFDYRDGLRRAGSPYAYLTVGSAMSFRAGAYAACGGMRKRRTGEDFYFLEALAKSSGFAVRQLDDVLVFPSARLSERVPVGTGTKLAEMLSGGLPTRFDASAFSVLGEMLQAATAERLRRTETFLAAMPAPARRFLEERGFSVAWDRVARQTSPERLRNEFLRWFDALKTLQFLKSLS